MRSVSFHPEAVGDARGAIEWYRERSPDLAEALLAELDGAVAAIGESPERWPRYERETRRYLMRRFPYSVVYRISGARIEILAVAHARREPGFWRGRR